MDENFHRDKNSPSPKEKKRKKKIESRKNYLLREKEREGMIKKLINTKSLHTPRKTPPRKLPLEKVAEKVLRKKFRK